jgi:hypothetical protein
MKLTKGIITRDDALRLCPDYVAFVENVGGDGTTIDKILEIFEKIRPRTNGITAVEQGNHLVFIRVRVTSVNRNDPRAEDGPIVRVSNGEYSWRVDGNKYLWPLLPTRVVDEVIRSVSEEGRIIAIKQPTA